MERALFFYMKTISRRVNAKFYNLELEEVAQKIAHRASLTT